MSGDLLLAARMNNFRRSVQEIVQVVKIADTTLKKRLEEFKATLSGTLTLADFRNVWLEDEMDPPVFTKGKEREEAERAVGEQGGRDEEQEFQNVKRKGKAKADEHLNIDPALLQQSIPITTDSVLETPSLTPTLTFLMDETYQAL